MDGWHGRKDETCSCVMAPTCRNDPPSPRKASKVKKARLRRGVARLRSTRAFVRTGSVEDVTDG